MLFFTVFILVSSSGFSLAEIPKIYTDGWTSVDADFRTWITNETVPLGPGSNETTYVVPYSVTGLSLICNATFPIEWNFHRERWGRRATWSTWVTTTRISDPSTLKPILFSSELRFLGTDIKITGNYTCQAYGNPDLSSSVYIYWEGSGSPFLTLGPSSKKRTITYDNKKYDSFKLPCTVSRPDIPVDLVKIIPDKNVTVGLKMNDSISYNPAVGFTLQYLPDPYGQYRCSVGDIDDDDYIDFEVVSGNDVGGPEFNDIKWKSASFEYDTAKKQFVCCSNNNKPPKMANYDCNHPIMCRLRMHTLHTIENNPKRLVSGNCAMIKLRRNPSPGVVRCVGDSIDLVREYFFPLSRPFQNDSIQPYYSWTKAEPSKMMKLPNLTHPFYVGQTQTFNCEISPFYYSEGIHWSIKYKNSTSYSLKGNQTRIGRRHPFELFMKGNIAKLTLTAEIDLESITCHAPVWNTTEWHTLDLKFDVRKPTKPQINGPTFEELNFQLNVTNQTLTCSYSGIPTPRVSWKKDNKTVYKNVIAGNGSSSIMIPRVGLEAHGIYTCNISNVGGFEMKVFSVYVSVGVTAEVIGLYVFAAICLVGVAIGGFFGFKKMQQQKEAIRRLANVAFKDVVETTPSQPHYPDPNNPFPAVLPTNGNGFSNNGFLNNGTNNDAATLDFGRYHKM